MANKSIKPRKRRASAKQQTSTLFYLWHNLRDIKGEAEQMKDDELVLLLGMAELLVEDRISSLNVVPGTMLAAAEAARPH